MAPNRIYERDILVNGTTIASIIDGMEPYGNLGRIILSEVGIDNVSQDTQTWYLQELWLKAFRKIADTIGSDVLFEIGKKIPENAEFPPNGQNVIDGLRSIDIAYHLNHMNVKGEILYNEKRTPKMLEGIGHYLLDEQSISPKSNSVIMKCKNPYPCDFDRGIITAICGQYGVTAKVTHMDEMCRKKDNSTCSYFISW